MRKLAPALRDSPAGDEVNLTPMLDVVFIMLIFFVLTASFVREAGLDAHRSSDSIEPSPNSDAILVTIDESDQIWVEGRTIDPRAVRANLERLHAQDPESPVVIQTSKSSSVQTLVLVMDAARLTDVNDILIASETDTGSRSRFPGSATSSRRRLVR